MPLDDALYGAGFAVLDGAQALQKGRVFVVQFLKNVQEDVLLVFEMTIYGAFGYARLLGQGRGGRAVVADFGDHLAGNFHDAVFGLHFEHVLVGKWASICAATQEVRISASGMVGQHDRFGRN